MFEKYFTAIAGLCGFAGVALGALAAHKAHDAYAAVALQQASLYALVHSAAILALSGKTSKAAQIGCVLFISGIALFSGGLALKAFTDIVIGPMIPIGGTCLMVGWLSIVIEIFVVRPKARKSS